MAKTFLLIIFFGLLVSISRSQEPDLFPVQKNGKAGFIDRTGHVAIPLKFDETRNFSDGLAPVRVGDDWGYVDKLGKVVITPRFFQADPFQDGFAPVGVYHPGKKIIDSTIGYYNYVDKTGKLINLEHYYVAFRFSEGLACVLTNNGRHVYIDATGREVFEFYTYESWIKNGRALFKTKGNMPESRTGFIDQQGKIAIAANFLGGNNFSEGLACVYDDKGSGFIDTSGEVAIPFKYEDCGSFSDGMASVRLNGKVGFIDKTGKTVIPPRFGWNPGDESKFSDGVAVVQVGEGEKPSTNGVRDVTLAGGSILANTNGLFGVIDKTGNFIIAAQYVQIGDFHNGLAWVNLSDSYIIHGETNRWAISIK